MTDQIAQRYGKLPSEMFPDMGDDPLIAYAVNRACFLAGTRWGETPKPIM